MLSFYPLSGRAISGTPVTTYIVEPITSPLLTILPSAISPAVYGQITANNIPVYGAFV